MKKEYVSISNVDSVIAEWHIETKTQEERDLYIEIVKKYCKENDISYHIGEIKPYKPLTYKQFKKIYSIDRNDERDGFIKYSDDYVNHIKKNSEEIGENLAATIMIVTYMLLPILLVLIGGK